MSSFTVIYDACVLYPAPLRDLLIRLAPKDLFRAKWTERILDEMERSILKNRSDLTADQIGRTRQRMNSYVRDALVSGYEPFENAIELPDVDDRHVVAAAIRCHAQIIVTFNLKDFPPAVLSQWGMVAQHPDDFLENLLDLQQRVVLEVIREQRAALQRPAYSIEQLLNTFSSQSLPKTVEILQEFASLL